MADLGIIFLRRKHTIHWLPVIIYNYYRKYEVPLFLGHPVYGQGETTRYSAVTVFVSASRNVHVTISLDEIFYHTLYIKITHSWFGLFGYYIRNQL